MNSNLAKKELFAVVQNCDVSSSPESRTKMERYGRGTQSDPETGLEESMWQLGIGGGGDAYPERPNEADCIYYLKTGFCGFGSRCRFNHPPDRSVVAGALRSSGMEFPERLDQPVCQYYMRTGMCKFGTSCKYHHPRQGGGGSGSHVQVNYLGYPLRPGEKECPYYMKTGQCKFGETCKFHHPPPAGVSVPTTSLPPGASPVPATAFYSAVQTSSVPASQQYGVMTGTWPVARSHSFLPGSYIQGTYGPMVLPPGMVPVAGWGTYPATVNPMASPGTQPAAGSGPLYGLAQLSPSAPAYAGAYASIPSSAGPSSSSVKEHVFPERPGQPECQYYMKTGDCKFGSSCRYHHPPESIASQAACTLSPMNLPLRPGAPPCTYYTQHGVCKFGPTCKFHHPIGTGTLSYCPSASSLADMPVAPYPVGSSIGTLAPSSSSSEMQTGVSDGSNKESSSTRMSSSISTSGAMVGSIVSTDEEVLHTGTELSGQSSSPSTGSDEMEARSSS